MRHGPDQLTPRELEVILLASEGFSITETAERLWLAVGTVKSIRLNASRVLGARNITHAVAIVLNNRCAQTHRNDYF